MVATLSKLIGISSIVVFNLFLALIFAMITVGAFSIVFNLLRILKRGFKTAIGFGLVAAGFVTVLGNLEGVLELMHCHNFQSARFWEWADIGSLHGPGGGNPPYASTEWYPTDWYWWWRASRVVGTTDLDYTINEFPFWSSFFADLHAHLIVIPFALLNMAIGLELFLQPISIGFNWIKRHWAKLILIAICLGALVFLNSWDFPIYIILFIIFIALGEYMDNKRGFILYSLDSSSSPILSSLHYENAVLSNSPHNNHRRRGSYFRPYSTILWDRHSPLPLLPLLGRICFH
jgi:uncharacterized membrane protein